MKEEERNLIRQKLPEMERLVATIDKKGQGVSARVKEKKAALEAHRAVLAELQTTRAQVAAESGRSLPPPALAAPRTPANDREDFQDSPFVPSDVVMGTTPIAGEKHPREAMETDAQEEETPAARRRV